jgi:Right handed beta helix region
MNVRFSILLHTLLPSLGLCLTLSLSADARTWMINVDSSAQGDTVLVGPGTYYENVEFRREDQVSPHAVSRGPDTYEYPGINVVLKSMMGPEATTLDGSTLDSAVVGIRWGQDRRTVVEGFRITGGSGGSSFGLETDLGGGIHIFKSEPMIKGNIIEGNTAIGHHGTGWGGGIYCFSGLRDPIRYPLVEDNLIRGNRAATNGRGIGLGGNAAAEIKGNIIVDNTAEAGDGGGIWGFLSVNDARIQSNRIEHNLAGDHGGGVYITLEGADGVDISSNLVLDNTARGRAMTGDSGGGIWLSRSSGIVRNNTIVGNHGLGGDGTWGGGLVLRYPGSPIVERNIIALSPEGGGILCREGSTPVIQNNLAWGNAPADGGGSCANWYRYTGDGNIQADPLFCDGPNGDFSLPPNSPAFTHPAGVLGAILSPGCAMGTLTLPVTWGEIKARFWR